MILVIGLPRSGTTFIGRSLQLALDVNFYSEPLREAILYGRNQFACGYTSIQKTFKYLPFQFKRQIYNHIYEYLRGNPPNMIVKETYRSHIKSDFPTIAAIAMAKLNPLQCIPVTRSINSIINSICARADVTSFSSHSAFSMIYNYHCFNSFIQRTEIPPLSYESYTAAPNKERFLFDLYPQLFNNDIARISKNLQQSSYRGIGDSHALHSSVSLLPSKKVELPQRCIDFIIKHDEQISSISGMTIETCFETLKPELFDFV